MWCAIKAIFPLLLLLLSKESSNGEADIKNYIICDICAFKVITVPQLI